MIEQSPYSPPKSTLLDTSNVSEEIYGFKKLVIQNEEDGEKWPSRCYKCNAEVEQKKQVTLYHVNPWAYLTILISPLILIILSLIIRKKFVISLPICEEHIQKRKRFIISNWIVLVLTLIIGFVGVAHDLPVMIVISTILFLYLVIAAVVSRRAFIAKRKNGQLWIRGAKKEFISSLPSYSE